jgi:hypothetical protein
MTDEAAFHPSAFILHPCVRGTVRKSAKRRSSKLGDVRVRLPPVQLLGLWSSRWPVKPLSQSSEVDDERLNSFTTHWIRPVRLSVQDGGPSSRKGGFDSRTGQLKRPEARGQRPGTRMIPGPRPLASGP